MTITKQELEKLAQFDTPTICNVIELFEVRPRNEGFMDHRTGKWEDERKVCGNAFRARVRGDMAVCRLRSGRNAVQRSTA